MICADCGQEIIGRRHTAKRCIDCAERRERLQIKEGKIRSKTRNSREYTSFKDRVHLVQGDACAICGWHIPKITSGGCIAHHITEVANGGSNDINNGIVLCPNCHALVHYGLIKKRELRVYVKEAVAKKMHILRQMIDKVRPAEEQEIRFSDSPKKATL